MPTIHKCNFDGRTGGKIVNGKETPKNAYPFMVKKKEKIILHRFDEFFS